MYQFNDLESLVNVKLLYSKTPYLARKSKDRRTRQSSPQVGQEAIKPLSSDAQLDQSRESNTSASTSAKGAGVMPGWQENKQAPEQSVPTVEEKTSAGSSDRLPINTAPADATATTVNQGPGVAPTSSEPLSQTSQEQIKKQVDKQWDPVFKRLQDFKESLRQLDIRRRSEDELTKVLDELNSLSQELRTPTSRELPDTDRSKTKAKQAIRKKRGSGEPLPWKYDDLTGQMLIPACDEFGDPMLDEDGDPIFIPMNESLNPTGGSDGQVGGQASAPSAGLTIDEIYRDPGLTWADAVRLAKEDPGLTIAGEALLSFYVGTRNFAIPAPPRDFYASFISPLAQHVTSKLYLPMRYSIALIIAITHGESSYGRRTRNPKSNAQGYIQLIPGSRAGLKQIYGLPDWDENTSKDDLQMNLIYSQAYFSRLAERLKNLGIRQKIYRGQDGTLRGEIEITAPLINKEAIIAALQRFPVMTNGNDFRLLLIIIFHAVGLGVSDMITRRDALVSRFLVCKHIETALNLRDMGISVPIFKGRVEGAARKRPAASSTGSNQQKKTTLTGSGGQRSTTSSGEKMKRGKKGNKTKPTTGGSSGDPFLQFRSLFC
jgi:hypothetical protein